MSLQDFLKMFDEFSRIGYDERYGANRVALTEHDIEARAKFISTLREINAEVDIDDAGNIYGSVGKNRNGVISIGSHMDSVPNGGRFDGMYGVVSGLQMLKELSREKMDVKLVAVDFTNEEGSRWQPDLLGSGLATGIFDRDFVYSRTDEKGLKFGDVLMKTGFKGEEKNRIKNIKPDYYIEPHIEQGPVLENEGYDIGIPQGIVTDIVDLYTFEGEANQAGPTPMNVRRDALVAASTFIERVNGLANKLAPRIVMTVGEIRNAPNVYSVVPQLVQLKLDIRSPEKNLAYENEKAAMEIAQDIANEKNVSLKIEKGWFLDTIHFDEELIETIEKSCRDLNMKYKYIYSWATHDAMNMNKITRTAMVMIPSHNGRSHTKEEYSSDSDLIKGFRVLGKTIGYLTGKS